MHFNTPHPPQTATSPTRGEVILNQKLFSSFPIRRKMKKRYEPTSLLVGEVAAKLRVRGNYSNLLLTPPSRNYWNTRDYSPVFVLNRFKKVKV